MQVNLEQAEELVRHKAEEDELTLSEKLLIESAAEKEKESSLRIKPEPVELMESVETTRESKCNRSSKQQHRIYTIIFVLFTDVTSWLVKRKATTVKLKPKLIRLIDGDRRKISACCPASILRTGNRSLL